MYLDRSSYRHFYHHFDILFPWKWKLTHFDPKNINNGTLLNLWRICAAGTVIFILISTISVTIRSTSWHVSFTLFVVCKCPSGDVLSFWVSLINDSDSDYRSHSVRYAHMHYQNDDILAKTIFKRMHCLQVMEYSLNMMVACYIGQFLFYIAFIHW